MSMFNNGFVRFLLSGFGTGTMAGKAFGITIFIFLFVFIVAWQIVKAIFMGVQKVRRKSASDNSVTSRHP